MMKYLMIFMLIIPFLSMAGISKSDTLNPHSKEQVSVVGKEQNKTSTFNSETYYKLMYENAKEENSKLLSLLTTSLTVIIAVILAIIGSSFFYNYRFNKKEYELQTKETVGRIEAVQKELLKETRLKIEELSKSNQAEIDKKFAQISETYKTNFETVKDSLKTVITSFKQDVDKNISSHEKTITSITEKLEQIENDAKEDLKLNEKSLKIDILDIRADLYYMKDWYSLALSNYIDQANLCVETNNSWKLEYIVSDILKSTEKVIEKGDTITPATKANLEKLLPNIPTYLSDKKKNIEEKYKEIEVKEIEIPNRRFGMRLFGGNML